MQGTCESLHLFSTCPLFYVPLSWKPPWILPLPVSFALSYSLVSVPLSAPPCYSFPSFLLLLSLYPVNGDSMMAGGLCPVPLTMGKIKELCVWEGGIHFPLYFPHVITFFLSLGDPHMLTCPCFFITHQLFIFPHLHLIHLIYALRFPSLETQSSLYHSPLLHFIVTTTIWGKLGWEHVTVPGLLTEFPQQSGHLNLDVPVSSLKL